MSNDVMQAWREFCATRGGDAAFEPFYAATVRPVWSICRHILRHDDDAQDALQMAYARLLAIARDPEAARAVDDPAALVRRLAIREATNLRKRLGRRSLKEAAVEHIAALPDRGRSPGEEAARRELRGRLEALISLLPDRYRVPLLLHYFEGMTHEEIAAALGQKRTTITVRLQRGLKKLEPLARRAGLGSAPAALAGIAGAGLLEPPAALGAAAVLDAASGLAASMTGAAALAAAGMGAAGSGASLTGSLFAGGSAIVNTKLALTGAAAILIIAAGVALYVNQSKPFSPSSESISSIANTNDDGRSDEATPSNSVKQVAGSAIGDQPGSGVIASEDAATTTATLANAAPTPAVPSGHGRITGRVVLDATGEPAAGASVAWLNKSGRGGDELPDKTGADGSFEVPNLPPGTYYIMAMKGALRSEPSREQAREITLERDGEAVGPVEIRLREGRALRVRVTDQATKQPIRGAEAKLNNGTVQTTNEQGETVFTGQEAKERSVEVTVSGFAKQNKTANLTAAPETLLEIALQPGGSLVGVVSDEAGQPIADVEIRDAYSGPVSFGWKTKTAADGSYRFDNLPLRTKIFGIIYEKDGYVGHWANDIELTDPAAPLEYNVTLKRGLSLAGSVTDGESKPIADATVEYGTQNNPSHRETKTGADGRFRLETLTDEDWAKQLYVQAKGYSPKKMKVEPGSPDAPPEITIVLAKGHWIKGRVVDEAGQPRQGVYISPLGFDHHYLADGRFITKADGKFEYESLPPDALFDFYGDAISEQRNVKLTLDRDDVIVTILGEGWIIGRVEDEETEEPITKFNIKISNTQGCPEGSGFASLEVSRMSRGADFTSDKGLFELRDLQIGPAYMISVEAEGYPPAPFDCQLAQTKEKAEPVTLKMKRGGETIRGVVQDKDGKPIAGAEITVLVYRNANRTETWFNWESYKRNREIFLDYRVAGTNDEGRFEFINVSGGRPMDILVTAENYSRTRIERLEDRPREEREKLVITLDTVARISVTVNRDVYPEAAQLDLRSASGGSFYNNKELGAGDAFEFPDLEPGLYKLSLNGSPHKIIAHNGQETTGYYSLVAKRISLEAGESREVKFPEGVVAAVSGQALQGGTLLANSRVALMGHAPENITITVRLADTDGDGRFRFPAIESGSYTPLLWSNEPLSNQDIRTRPTSDDIIVGGSDIECVFEFSITGTVRGRLLGMAKKECILTLQPHAANSEMQIHPQAKPGPDGAFVFNDVKAGDYSLMINYTSSAQPPTGQYRQLIKSVVITDEQRDVDLGDVPMPSGGQVRITASGPVLDENATINVMLYKDGAGAGGTLTRGEAMMTSWMTRTLELVLDDLPAGRHLICAAGNGWRSDPPLVPVDVIEGQLVSATIPMTPMTELRFTPQPAADFRSATLQSADGSQTFTVSAQANGEYNDENLLATEPVVLLFAKWGRSVNIAPGEWTLSVTDTEGLTDTQTFSVQPGQPVSLDMKTIR